MKRFTVETPNEMTEQERETLETLLHYPSLERVFAEDVAAGAEKIKEKMQAKIHEAERVVRRGAPVEAEKAAKISAALQTTINFLDELERMRNAQTK